MELFHPVYTWFLGPPSPEESRPPSRYCIWEISVCWDKSQQIFTHRIHVCYIFIYTHLYLVVFLEKDEKINIPYMDPKGLKLAPVQQLADLADLKFDSSLKVYLNSLHIFFRTLFVTRRIVSSSSGSQEPRLRNNCRFQKHISLLACVFEDPQNER